MARKPGGAGVKGAKGSKRAGASGASDAQLRKDPAFMKHLESAIIAERARADVAAKASGSKASAPEVAVPEVAVKASGSKVVKDRSASATQAKAAASPRKGRKPDAKALAAELSSLIPKLDSEGLAFLIEQARVHLYNMRVAELEDAAVEAERASNRVQKALPTDEFRIHAAANGSTYDLVWHDKWKMFTDEEMLAMVRITSSKDAVAEVGGRLYRWLLAERRDVLADIPFSGLADPKLKKLVALLRKTFTVKGKK